MGDELASLDLEAPELGVRELAGVAAGDDGVVEERRETVAHRERLGRPDRVHAVDLARERLLELRLLPAPDHVPVIGAAVEHLEVALAVAERRVRDHHAHVRAEPERERPLEDLDRLRELGGARVAEPEGLDDVAVHDGDLVPLLVERDRRELEAPVERGRLLATEPVAQRHSALDDLALVEAPDLLGDLRQELLEARARLVGRERHLEVIPCMAPGLGEPLEAPHEARPSQGLVERALLRRGEDARLREPREGIEREREAVQRVERVGHEVLVDPARELAEPVPPVGVAPVAHVLARVEVDEVLREVAKLGELRELGGPETRVRAGELLVGLRPRRRLGDGPAEPADEEVAVAGLPVDRLRAEERGAPLLREGRVLRPALDEEREEELAIDHLVVVDRLLPAGEDRPRLVELARSGEPERLVHVAELGHGAYVLLVRHDPLGGEAVEDGADRALLGVEREHVPAEERPEHRVAPEVGVEAVTAGEDLLVVGEEAARIDRLDEPLRVRSRRGRGLRVLEIAESLLVDLEPLLVQDLVEPERRERLVVVPRLGVDRERLPVGARDLEGSVGKARDRDGPVERDRAREVVLPVESPARERDRVPLDAHLRRGPALGVEAESPGELSAGGDLLGIVLVGRGPAHAHRVEDRLREDDRAPIGREAHLRAADPRLEPRARRDLLEAEPVVLREARVEGERGACVPRGERHDEPRVVGVRQPDVIGVLGRLVEAVLVPALVDRELEGRVLLGLERQRQAEEDGKDERALHAGAFATAGPVRGSGVTRFLRALSVSDRPSDPGWTIARGQGSYLTEIPTAFAPCPSAVSWTATLPRPARLDGTRTFTWSSPGYWSCGPA